MKQGYIFFAVGVVYGFGLGVMLDITNLINVTSISWLAGLLIAIPTVGWLETSNHERRVDHWVTIRAKGKFAFVAGRYIILRGGIFCGVLILSLSGESLAWPAEGIALPLALLAISFVGSQEWRNCELDHGLLLRRNAVERTNIQPEQSDD